MKKNFDNEFRTHLIPGDECLYFIEEHGLLLAKGIVKAVNFTSESYYIYAYGDINGDVEIVEFTHASKIDGPRADLWAQEFLHSFTKEDADKEDFTKIIFYPSE